MCTWTYSITHATKTNASRQIPLSRYSLTLPGTGHFASFHGTGGWGVGGTTPVPIRPWLTRALLGLWIFHRLLGGAFERPPPWSRLLVAVEKNERQRSKAREKSFRNHFGHFLAQVKIGVSRGQNSKIFQNGFSTIKSLILKIEQRIWYHCVCLVKARRTIYKNDFERSKSKFDLRSSQAKVTWWPKWVILHITRFAWPRRTYWHQSHVSISFWSKVIGNLRLVTSGDLKWPLEG